MTQDHEFGPAVQGVRQAIALLGMVRSVTFELYEESASAPIVGLGSKARKLKELDTTVDIIYEFMDSALESFDELEPNMVGSGRCDASFSDEILDRIDAINEVRSDLEVAVAALEADCTPGNRVLDGCLRSINRAAISLERVTAQLSEVIGTMKGGSA